MFNAPAGFRFIFDDRGQAADRLKLKLCDTARDAFRWFCKWSLDVSKRGPGKKVLFVDELWQWCDAKSNPVELENIVRTEESKGWSH